MWRYSVQRLTEIRSRNLGITDINPCTPLSKVSVTVPIFMKLAFSAQIFVKSCCTEFCENRTNGLGADSIFEAVGQTDVDCT